MPVPDFPAMNSLSDSQNIDFDPDAASPLPPTSAVQACPACTVLIDISGTEPLEQISCPRCAAAFAVHGQIAHYRIIEIAGRGGMGVVYRAYDPSLERDVALKVLRKDHSDNEGLVQQLEAEAGITATVNDPHVVRVYGTGFDRGRFYIVMELAGRGSLDDLIQLQGRVVEAQVLQVGIQVARGLRAALQAGLIHRDVKPGNILFADAQSAKIGDFGLAIFMAQEESVRGELWGSPYYVAPEKLEQKPEDFRSDMYSLGGTLFHALAGRPPFEAETGSLVALKHLKSQPVSLQSFAPWASNCTAHIINRCLLKDPAQRYQSYDELIESLDYALAQLRAQGDQAAPKVRVTMETAEDQKRLSRVVLAMIAIMVLLALGFFALQSKQAKDARARIAAGATVRDAAKLAALQEPIQALAALRPDAAELFAKAAADPALSPNERAWAQLLEGAARLAANQPAESREAFDHVAPLAARMPDPVVGGFIQKTAARLTTTEPVSPAATQLLSTTNHEAVALLLYGLHDWGLGKTDDAVALLRQFRSAKPVGPSAWIEELKWLAINLIERSAQFQVATARLKSASDAASRSQAADALRKVDQAFAKAAAATIAPYQKEIDAYNKSRLEAPPVVLWDLDTNFDVTTAGVNLTASGAGAKIVTTAPLSGAGSASFDGASYAASPSASTYAFANQTFTVSLWVKAASTASGVVLSNGGSSMGWAMEVAGAKAIIFLKSAKNSQISRASTALVADGTWHHVATVITTNTVTETSSTINIYVDGRISQGETFYPGTGPYADPGATKAIALGARDVPKGPTKFFTGNVDEVKIWNTGLTATEINHIYLMR